MFKNYRLGSINKTYTNKKPVNGSSGGLQVD